jgi:hypothetical protein
MHADWKKGGTSPFCPSKEQAVHGRWHMLVVASGVMS